MKKQKVSQLDADDVRFERNCNEVIVHAIFVIILLVVLLCYMLLGLLGETSAVKVWVDSHFGDGLEVKMFCVAFVAVTWCAVHVLLWGREV